MCFEFQVILVCGVLYPAYKSFKAVRTKDARGNYSCRISIMLSGFFRIHEVDDVLVSIVYLGTYRPRHSEK